MSPPSFFVPPHADRIAVAQDRRFPAPGPYGITLIQAANVDQSVRAQAGRLGLQRGDSFVLARIRRQPKGSAPRIHRKIAHEFILILCELSGFIDLDFAGATLAAILRVAGAAGEHACHDGDKR